MASIRDEDLRAALVARLQDEDEETAVAAIEGRIDFFERELIRKHRTIVISEEVSARLTRRLIPSIFWLDAESDRPIRVLINTPGGSADDGFAIFDALRAIRSPVSTIAVGIAASAGTIILLAGAKERRFALPNARLLIHQPSTFARGPAKDVEITAQEIVKLRERANKLLSDECKRPLAQVQADTQRDYWMSAEEAVAYGLIGKVVKGLSDIKG
ncbi:MAG: ATP-dependent Clp protease proteolytic subunit [Planctomycetes bacterium]|nr:ATP-dependent Clp protease proteolytic subunit [Planctomycetota bacterium]